MMGTNLRSRIERLEKAAAAENADFTICGIDAEGKILHVLPESSRARRWVGRSIDDVSWSVKVLLVGPSNTPPGEEPWNPFVEDGAEPAHA